MARLIRGKGKFYRKCRFDDTTKKIIKFYNDNLRYWKRKEAFIDLENLTREGEQ